MAKTIGLLVVDLEGSYSSMIWPEVVRFTRAKGHDCLILPANNPEYPYHYLSQFNILYNFARKGIVDALIIIPSTFENFLSPDQVQKLIEKIQTQVPVVSLNTKVEGAPSLLINNHSGIEDGVEHLVRVHGLRRIGFMSGPADNRESMIRKESFLKKMEQEGCPVEDEWLMTGDFTEPTAHSLTWEKGQYWVRDLDAIITANDYMAMGIIRSLKNQGFNIPKDLAVIGFDDFSKAPYLDPPLSTVRQPFRKMVRAAVNLALDLCEGKEKEDEFFFDTELVIRSSCGCTDFLSNETINREFHSIKSSSVQEDLRNLINDKYNPTIRERLEIPLRRIYAFIENEQPSKENVKNFLKLLEAIIDKEFVQYHFLPDWHYLFTLLLHYLEISIPEKVKLWRASEIFERSQYFISRKIRSWQGYQDILQQELTMPLRSLQQNMAMVFDHKGMVETLAEWSKYLNLKNCFISLYSGDEMIDGLYSSLPEKSMMIMAYKDGILRENVSVENPLLFPTLDLWPAPFKPVPSGKAWTVAPLYNRDRRYGLVISEITDYNGSFNETIRHQLSVTLHSCFLYNQRKQAESRLENILRSLEKDNRELARFSLFDELTGLLNRRGFMKQAADMIQIGKESSCAVAITFADMDGLKKINDSLGHAEGDAAINDMAEILKKAFRDDDIIARLGGDEFTVLSLDVPEDFQDVLDKRIHSLLERFNKTRRRPYHLSFSQGTVMAMADDVELPLIMKKADELLYERKKRKKH